MPKEDKVEAVQHLEEEIRESNALLLTDYRGLNVSGITALRRKLQESGSEYRVVKNTLFKCAIAGASDINLDYALEGPTAVAFVRQDAIAAAKALADFIKEHKVPGLKGGLVEGQIISGAQIESLAKIPPRPVLYSQLLGAMQSPVAGFVGTLHSMISNLVYTLQSVADQKTA